MSLRRKIHDGDVLGGSPGNSEWRNPLSDQAETSKSTTSKRTRRTLAIDEPEDDLFADEGEKDRYLITYADLITLLLGLFIILYAISNIDIKKYEEMISAMGNVFGTEKFAPVNVAQAPNMKSVIQPIKTLKNSLQSVIDVNGYTKVVKLDENERGITISILEDILFASGNSELSNQSQLVLANLASILKRIPNDIRIEGHTDNVPINSKTIPSNWHLSVQRATNTAYYLMNELGIQADKVSVVGFAEYKPLASNETPEGRSQNRRVDIVILKQ